MFTEGAFLVFKTAARGCSCYSYKSRDHNMPPAIADDRLLDYDFYTAQKLATYVIMSMENLRDLLTSTDFGDPVLDKNPRINPYREFHKVTQRGFFAFHMREENASGPSQFLGSRRFNWSMSYDVDVETFFVYWFRFDNKRTVPRGVCHCPCKTRTTLSVEDDDAAYEDMRRGCHCAKCDGICEKCRQEQDASGKKRYEKRLKEVLRGKRKLAWWKGDHRKYQYRYRLFPWEVEATRAKAAEKRRRDREAARVWTAALK